MRGGGKNLRPLETSTREEDATDHRSQLSSGMGVVAGRVAYQWPRQRNAEVKPNPICQTRTKSSETEQSAYSSKVLGARSQNSERRLKASSCLSVRPHGTTRLLLDRF